MSIVEIEIQDSIAFLVLNRPEKKNAGEARTWPAALAAFAVVMIVPGLVSAVLALITDVALRGVRSDIPCDHLVTVAEFVLWMAVIVAGTVILRQLFALPAFTFAFLLVRSKCRLWVAALYACAVFLVLYGLFDQLVNVTWYPAFFP